MDVTRWPPHISGDHIWHHMCSNTYDALIGHVRFDERGWETGRRLGVSARAHPRLYKLPDRSIWAGSFRNAHISTTSLRQRYPATVRARRFVLVWLTTRCERRVRNRLLGRCWSPFGQKTRSR